MQRPALATLRAAAGIIPHPHHLKRATGLKTGKPIMLPFEQPTDLPFLRDAQPAGAPSSREFASKPAHQSLANIATPLYGLRDLDNPAGLRELAEAMERAGASPLLKADKVREQYRHHAASLRRRANEMVLAARLAEIETTSRYKRVVVFMRRRRTLGFEPLTIAQIVELAQYR